MPQLKVKLEGTILRIFSTNFWTWYTNNNLFPDFNDAPTYCTEEKMIVDTIETKLTELTNVPMESDTIEGMSGYWDFLKKILIY